MKKVSIIAFSILVFFLAVGFQTTQPDVKKNVGALGDVKYSVLEPGLFKKINGDGWVPMDGRIIAGDDLEKRTGMKSIPDARGIFIRGMNLGRDINTGDPDGDKNVGRYQTDGVGPHKHRIAGGANGPGAHSTVGGNMEPFVSDDGLNTLPETRPRNIALYVYIKISE